MNDLVGYDELIEQKSEQALKKTLSRKPNIFETYFDYNLGEVHEAGTARMRLVV